MLLLDLSLYLGYVLMVMNSLIYISVKVFKDHQEWFESCSVGLRQPVQLF